MENKLKKNIIHTHMKKLKTTHLRTHQDKQKQIKPIIEKEIH